MRADLAPGLQLAQAVHAAIGLAQVPVTAGGSPAERSAASRGLPATVVVLAVADEPSLFAAVRAVGDGGHLFREPDLDGQATAFAVVSDGAPFSDLRLALGGAMV